MERILNRTMAAYTFMVLIISTIGLELLIAQEVPAVPERYRTFFRHYAAQTSYAGEANSPLEANRRAGLRNIALITEISHYNNLEVSNQASILTAEHLEQLTDLLKNQAFFDEVVVLANEHLSERNLAYFLHSYFPQRLKQFPRSRFFFLYTGKGFTLGKNSYLLKNTAQNPHDISHSISVSNLIDDFGEIIESSHQVFVLINSDQVHTLRAGIPVSGQSLSIEHPGAHALFIRNRADFTESDGGFRSSQHFLLHFIKGLKGASDTVFTESNQPGGDGIITLNEMVAFLNQEYRALDSSIQPLRLLDISYTESRGSFFFINGNQHENEVSSAKYYKASAGGVNDTAAIDAAVDILIQQVADDYASAYDLKRIIIKQDINSSVASIINTYADDIKKHLEVFREPLRDSVRVSCRLSSDAMEKVFEDRESLAINIYRRARENKRDLDLKSALKRYYFSIILMYSLPQPKVLFENLDLVTEVPKQMKQIFEAIEFEVASDYLYSSLDRRTIVSAYYSKSPIAALEVCYSDGSEKKCAEGKDGKITLQLSENKFSPLEIGIQVKYSYLSKIPAVNSLWELVVRPRFRSYKRISLKNPVEKIDDEISLELDNPDYCPISEKIRGETYKFIQVLEASLKKKLTVPASYSDPFLQQKISGLIQYNHPINMEADIKATINKNFSGGWEVRRIPVLNQYPSIKKNVVDYLILDFSDDGSLLDINYSVYEKLYREFLLPSTNEKIKEHRQEVIKFLEKYRTAYLTRDMKTIEAIFADDALIIIGRIVETRRVEKNWQYIRLTSKQPSFERIILTKRKYLKRLKSLFNKQHDIYIGFSDFKPEPIIDGKADGYGLSMWQDYVSTTYSDIGYLFLLIDFISDVPKIEIRAWQPNEWDEESLINLVNYRYLGD